MTKKISFAIEMAKKFADLTLPGDGEETFEQATQAATAWALIAIAEALSEQIKQAEFAAEVEEMRQERKDHPYGF